METIFHEKQEGSLCAQHCLNTLLQGQYFTAIDLADIAHQLDDSEREKMAECGTQTDEYQNFIQEPSSNFDDSGFFSIQVISCALRVWSLEVVPFNSQDVVAVSARGNPVGQQAFICNFRGHWFTIRKIGRQWFNLNSLLTGPELISDTFLSLFLTQLQQEGYSIFVLVGSLPTCDADEVLKMIIIEQPIKPSLIADKTPVQSDDGDAELQKALAESKNMNEQDDRVLQETIKMTRTKEEESLLQRALQMSMFDRPCSSRQIETSTNPVNIEQVRERRLAYLSQPTQPSTSSQSLPTVSTEEEMLQAAIQMSMEQP